MANLASSDVTVTLDARDRHVLGKLRMSQGSLAFGDGAKTYPRGGIPMPAVGNFGMNKEVSMFDIVDASGDGLIYRYDQANRKIKIFTSAPPIIHEEKVTCTAKVGYLKWPAAHINYIVEADANYIPIAGDITPATGQCAVDQGFNEVTGVLTKGSRTKLTFFDAVTTCYVSYATQAWKELTDNMEQAKIVGAGSDVAVKTYGNSGMATNPLEAADIVSLGTDIIAMQSITWNNGGTISVPEVLKDGGTPAATLEMEIDFVNSGNAEVVCLQADAIDTLNDEMHFVYIKKPSAGFILDRFTNAGIAHSTDVIIFTGYPLIYGTCGQLPVTTSDKKAYWIKVSDTLAAAEINWTHHPWMPGATIQAVPHATCHADTDETLVPAWIAGDPSEIHTVPLEMPEADIIQATTLKFMAWGH